MTTSRSSLSRSPAKRWAQRLCSTKKISHIHAEAYPAGELKHGPLALVTEAMPVVVAPNDTLIEKLKSNLQEVRARRRTGVDKPRNLAKSVTVE